MHSHEYKIDKNIKKIDLKKTVIKYQALYIFSCLFYLKIDLIGKITNPIGKVRQEYCKTPINLQI